MWAHVKAKHARRVLKVLLRVDERHVGLSREQPLRAQAGERAADDDDLGLAGRAGGVGARAVMRGRLCRRERLLRRRDVGEGVRRVQEAMRAAAERARRDEGAVEERYGAHDDVDGASDEGEAEGAAGGGGLGGKRGALDERRRVRAGRVAEGGRVALVREATRRLGRGRRAVDLCLGGRRVGRAQVQLRRGDDGVDGGQWRGGARRSRERRLRLVEGVEERRHRRGVGGEGAHVAAAEGGDLGERLSERRRHDHVGVERRRGRRGLGRGAVCWLGGLGLGAAVAVEDVLEWEGGHLAGQDCVRAAEREGVVLDRARRVALVGEPEPLALVAIEEVGGRAEHGERRERQDLDRGPEAEQKHREHVHRHVREAEARAHRRGRVGGADAAAQGERRLVGRAGEESAAGPRGRVGEEEGVRRPPPRDEVDVLQQRDAVVEAEARGGERHGGEVRRREQQQRRDCLKSDGADRGDREGGRRQAHVQPLQRVREGRGYAERRVRRAIGEEHGLEDESLQRRARHPRDSATTDAANRVADLADARTAVGARDDDLHHPARERSERLGAVARRLVGLDQRRAERQEQQRRREQHGHVRSDVGLAVEL